MDENKVTSTIKHLMNPLNQSLEKMENYKVTGNFDGLIQEADKAKAKLKELQDQFQTAGGIGLDKNLQDTLKTAQSYVQDYINFVNSNKDKLSMDDISRTATQNFDVLKSKVSEVMQTFEQAVNNPALDNVKRKIEEIANVNFDISGKVQQFTVQLEQMLRAVETLKTNMQNEINGIDFGKIGGDNAVNDLNTKLSQIFDKVQTAKDQINGEIGKMFSADSLSTDGFKQKFETFASEMATIGNDIKTVGENIKTNFGDLFSDLSTKVNDNTVSSLKSLSDVLSSLKDNNIEVKNPLAGIIESLEKISADKVSQLDSLSQSLGSILNINVDGNGTAQELLKLSEGLGALNTKVSDTNIGDITKLSESLNTLMTANGDSNVFSQIASGLSGLQGLSDIAKSFEQMKDIFQPQNFQNIADQFEKMQKSMEQMAVTMNSMNTQVNTQQPAPQNPSGGNPPPPLPVPMPLGPTGNLPYQTTPNVPDPRYGGSVTPVIERHGDKVISHPAIGGFNPYTQRPDQFYASADSLYQSLTSNSATQVIQNMRTGQHDLGNVLWDHYDNERYGQGGAPRNTRSGNQTRQALIENNEIEALINAVNPANNANLKSDLRHFTRQVNAYGINSADEDFGKIEAKVEPFIKNVEKLLNKFTDMKNIEGTIDGIDADKLHDALQNMVNNGQDFVSEINDALKELPAELRNQLKGNDKIEDFQKMVKEYNEESLKRILDADTGPDHHYLQEKYTDQSAYKDGTGKNPVQLGDVDFFMGMAGESSKNIKGITDGNASTLLSTMQGFNKLQSNGYYDDSSYNGEDARSSREIRRKTLVAGNLNKKLSEKHDALTGVMDSDDHNLIAQRATEFMESGTASMKMNNSIMGDMQSSVDFMSGKDMGKTLEMLKNMGTQAKETGQNVKDVMENIIKAMDAKAEFIDEKKKPAFLENLEKMKERLKEVTEQMEEAQRIRAAAFQVAMEQPLKAEDYEQLDKDNIAHLAKTSGAGYTRAEELAGNLKRDAYTARFGNMSHRNLWDRTFHGGRLDNNRNKMGQVSDLSRIYEAETRKMNTLYSDYEEAAAEAAKHPKDSAKQERATEMARSVAQQKYKMSGVAKQLTKANKMSKKDMKYATEEEKAIHQKGAELIAADMNLNSETMQMSASWGLDDEVEDLANANKELAHLKENMDASMWDKFTDGAKKAKGAIQDYLISPLNSVSSLIKGGMGIMGLGSLSALASNPLSISGLGQIAGKVFGDEMKYYQSQGQEQAAMRMNEVMAYGNGAQNNGYSIIGQGIGIQARTNGLIKSEELSASYNNMTRNVVGMYGNRQSDAQNQGDMETFANDSLMMQKGWGISEGSATNAISTYYKELGKNVRETEYELAKIGQTAQSLNVPYDKMLDSVTRMAVQYKQMGMNADVAGNVIGNLMFQHNMSIDDATKMAGDIGGALPKMNDGWLAYGATMNGMYADPIQAIVDLKYGYNDDGSQKDGVDKKLAQILTSNYQQMGAMGGSAGKYGMIKALEAMGITDQREVAKFLNHADDPEYVTKLLKDNPALTGGDDGKQPDKKKPEDYFNDIAKKIEGASGKLDEVSKLLNQWEVASKERAHEQQDKITKMLKPLEGLMNKFNGFLDTATDKLFDFIVELGDAIKKIKQWLDEKGITGFMGDHPLATLGTIAAGGALVRYGVPAAVKKIKNKLTGKLPESERTPRSGPNVRTTEEVVEDMAHGGRPGFKATLEGASKLARTGGKWGLITAGVAATGAMLFGNPSTAYASDGQDGNGGGGGFFGNLWNGTKNFLGGAGDALKGTAGIITILKDIYNVLIGNGPVSGVSGGSQGTDWQGDQQPSGGHPILAMAGIGATAGMARSLYKSRKAAKTKPSGEESKGKTRDKISRESRQRRQNAIDMENSERLQRQTEAFKRNRAAGQSPADAMKNAKAEEKLRSNSAFNRMGQEDYEKLFKNYKDPTKLSSKAGNLLKTGSKGFLKGLGAEFKGIPLIGNALAIGLSALDTHDTFKNLDGIAHMTGQSNTRAKARKASDEAVSNALMIAGGAAGTFIPIPVVGTAIGAGAGMAVDWGLGKLGVKDKVADWFGMGEKDIEKSNKKTISKKLQKEADEFQKRMKKNGMKVDDQFALVAASAEERNAKDLKGLSSTEKDGWAANFTSDYLSKIADGVDPTKAEKLAKEQTNKLVDLKVTNDQMKSLNASQLDKMVDVWKMSGANKDSLDKYSDNYFKKEGDAKKVLDATSKSTGLTVTQLEGIGKTLGLLPNQLAALIASSAGGKDKVDSFFDNSDEVNGLKKKLKKDGLGTAQVALAMEGYTTYYNDLKANNVTNSEREEWLKAYGVAASDKKLGDPLKYANKIVNSYRQADSAWNKGGLYDGFKKTLSDHNWQQYYRTASMPSGQTAHSVISNFADTAGMSTQALEAQMKKSGVTEDQFAKYLLAQDGDGKFDKDDVKSLMSKGADYNKLQIEKIDNLTKQTAQDAADSKKTAEQIATGNNKNRDTNQTTSDKNADERQSDNQNFHDKLQEAKVKADKEHTTSVIDALSALGDIVGQKLDSLGSIISSLSLGGNGGDQGTGGGEYVDQVANLIGANEGDYGSVNKNDNGALSIGKLQWHGNRARDLLLAIQGKDPQAFAYATQGAGLKSLSSDWSNYTLNSEQAKAISALLENSDAGKEAQDEQIKKDVGGYITKGKSLGITDPSALAYFADLYNQSPKQATAIAKAAGKGASLEALYDESMDNSVMSKYSSRRQAAYNKAKKITSFSDDQGTGGGYYSGDSAAAYYLNNFNVTTPFAPGMDLHDGYHPNGHNGIDLNKKGTTGNGDAGTAIESIVGGTVEKVLSASQSGGYGNRIIISGSDGREYAYSHLQSLPNFKAGQKVSAGQVIGKMGSTGHSSAAHLDLEVRKGGKLVNPLDVLKGMASGGSGDQGTGGGYNFGSATLKRGSKGGDVKELQQALKDAHYNPGSVDGIFGPKTEAALKAFEKAAGMAQDGVFDKKTMEALTKALDDNTSSTDKNTDKDTSKDANKNTITNKKSVLTNLSAYDPMSGIHPTSNLDYNTNTFDLYKQKGLKSVSENSQGVNMQDYARDLRKQFDVNIKTHVDASQHPDFTKILDEHFRVAAANAIKQAEKEMDSKYNDQFNSIWDTTLKQVNKSKDID